jgi:hypothetical protein
MISAVVTAVDLLLPAVVGRVVDAHRSAGGTDADLAGEREQAQAVAVEDVIIGHAAHLLSSFGDEEMSVSRTPDATRSSGWRRRFERLCSPATCRENSGSVQT